MTTFSVIGLPDTQKYADNYPETFKAQTQWVVDNQAAFNIEFVSHYGDVVEHGTNSDAPGEYAVAVEAMNLLKEANIPHGIAEGNHDSLPAGVHLPGIWDYDNTNFLQNFGPQWYQNQSSQTFDWFGGASPSGLSTYQTFGQGDDQFIALHIGLETPHAELAWAQGVINENRDKPVMVTTHRYLQDAEDYSADNILYLQTRPYDSGRVPDIWYSATGEILYNPNGMHAEDFFDRFVATNPNIFLVNAGHDAQEYRQTSTNLFGQPVHEVLADFTYLDNGGNGYLRIMEFDTQGDKIDVKSYSPTLGQYKTDRESQFTLNLDFDQYKAPNTAYFQNGISGYNSTQDTWVNEDAKNSSYGNSSELWVDDDTDNHWWYDYRGQALIEFDEITGDPVNGKIPTGATIDKAYLMVTVKDDIDHPIYDPDFHVYQMTRDWNESSTWNSLSGGLTGSDYGEKLGSFSGDDNPNDSEVRYIEITSAVQDWVNNPGSNYGVAIVPEIISGNDDGIELYASEANEIMFRPALIVEYSLA